MLNKRCEFWNYKTNIKNPLQYDFLYPIGVILSYCKSILNIPINFYSYLCMNYNLYYKNLKQLQNIEEQKDTPILGKIISWNIQYGNGCFPNCFTFPKMIEFLRNETPEICILQEVLDMPQYNQHNILKEKLDFQYSVYTPQSCFSNIKMGNLVLSSNPIDIVYSSLCFQLVETEVNHKKISIVNVHLTSDITCTVQNEEVDKLLEILKQRENILVVGDFNLPYWCSSIKKLKKELQIVPTSSYTFPSVYPIIQFDYCFYRNLENIKLHIPYEIKYSDHLPLILNIQ